MKTAVKNRVSFKSHLKRKIIYTQDAQNPLNRFYVIYTDCDNRHKHYTVIDD